MPSTHGAIPLGQKPVPPPAEQESPQEEEVQEIQYPPGLPKSLYARFRQYLALQDENVRSEQDLARSYGAGIQPYSATNLKLQILIDMLWPAGTPEGMKQRLELDLRYQEALARQWEALRSQVMQARLAQGANLSPQELAWLQAQQRSGAPGLLGG